MSENPNERRQFLKWLGLAPGAFMLAGCADSMTSSATRDAAGADAASSDAGGRDASRDAGLVDASGQDAAQTDAGGDVGESCEATGSDVEGPFHIDGAPERTVLANADEPGERLVIEGTVFGPDCATPVAGATLDVWHADDDGNYHDAQSEYRLRGQMTTDDRGRYRFETVKPGRYPLGGSTRPAHIHFIVTRPGYVPLTTQLYFSDDPFLKPNDPCGGGCNSGDPTLIIDLEAGPGEADLRGSFNIVLER